MIAFQRFMKWFRKEGHTGSEMLRPSLRSPVTVVVQGAEPAQGAVPRGGGGRLEFERQAAAAAEEADPFGLDQFLSEVKGGGRERGGRKGNALDAIGQRGGMSAAGGGASLEDAGAGAGMGRRMQFTSGSGR